MDEWFLGSSWLGYGGEVLYEKGYGHQDFLYKNAHLSFRHRASAGYFKENSKDKDDDDFGGYHEMGTLRLKYMTELRQTLFSLNDIDRTKEEEDERIKNSKLKLFDINLLSYFNATLFATSFNNCVHAGTSSFSLMTRY